MYDKNVKSECTPTKLHTFNVECICKRTTKFRWEILFCNEIINLQNLMTNLFDFQYSVRHTYCRDCLLYTSDAADE